MSSVKKLRREEARFMARAEQRLKPKLKESLSPSGSLGGGENDGPRDVSDLAASSRPSDMRKELKWS
jgi:hypothetical protein